MFQTGDYLVYGLEGVCRVTAVGPVRLSGVPRDKLYYTLAPCGRQDAIYIPVDSPVFMRPPLARGEIEPTRYRSYERLYEQAKEYKQWEIKQP